MSNDLGWDVRNGLTTMFLGAVIATGHAPLNLWPISFLALVIVFIVFDVKTAKTIAKYAWLLGFGYFLVTMNWMVEPFLVDVARHGWMAPFAIFGMAGGLALLWAIGAGLFYKLSGRWALILGVSAAEFVRGYIFTGFPWGGISAGFVFSPFSQLLATVGPNGLTLLLLCSSAGFAYCIRVRSIWKTIALSMILFVVFVFCYQRENKEILYHDMVVRLVQPNAPQKQKWDPDYAPIFFERMIEMTKMDPTPDVIIWPESALLYPLNYAHDMVKQIKNAANKASVIFGVLRFDQDGDLRNSLAILQNDLPLWLYDKSHLVPFGEYLPAQKFMHRIGLSALADHLGTGFVAGQGPSLGQVAPDFFVQPLICYEAIFPNLVGLTPKRANLLVQITNDAWFGNFSGPHQHLTQLKMRAIETGIPVARTANTGISAVIAPNGKILDQISLNTQGWKDVPIPISWPETLYGQFFEKIYIALFIQFFGFAVFSNRRKW